MNDVWPFCDIFAELCSANAWEILQEPQRNHVLTATIGFCMEDKKGAIDEIYILTFQ